MERKIFFYSQITIDELEFNYFQLLIIIVKNVIIKVWTEDLLVFEAI